MNGTATVPVKSAWLSKVNWTAIGTAVMTLITTNALGLDAATQVKVLSVTTIASNVLTIVFRTFFNGSVSPGSLSN